MTNLKRRSKIKREMLDEKNYFSSLLFLAQSSALLSDDEFGKIQNESLSLLAKEADKLTRSESSSVRIETAQALLSSIMFILSIQLKSYSEPDEAVEALKTNSLDELFNLGLKKTKVKVRTAKSLHKILKSKLFQTKNVFYADTMVKGIDGFFKLYNPEFSADEIHITADYPLFIPIDNLNGIEFIEKYLEISLLENKFCSYFSQSKVHRLLTGIDENYQQILMNIYESVFAVALGCIITQRNIYDLDCNHEELNCVFENKTEEEISLILNEALTKLTDELLCPQDLTDYLQKSVAFIAKSIRISSSLGHLETVFPQVHRINKQPQVTLHYGKRMSNSKYSDILDKLMETDDANIKAKIILENVNSFADLLDILRDCEPTENELLTLFKSFPLEILAALISHYPNEDFLSDDNEKTIYNSLQKFLSSLPNALSNKLTEAAQNLKFNVQNQN